jgi:photosystem II stability/assembly factor-like uncharacterized protein
MKRISSAVMVTAILALVMLSIGGTAMAQGQEDYWVWENPTPTDNDLYGVSALDTSHVWAVGDNGTVLFYDGTRWNSQISPTTNNLKDVWAISENDVWAVGDGGTIIHYDGSGWTINSQGLTDKNLRGISGCDATHLYAVGDSGTVLIYSGGPNWGQDGTFISSKNLYCVTVLDPTHVWCAGPRYDDGTGGHIYKWESATGWELEHTRGEPVWGVASLPGNYVWTVGDWGEVSERAPDGTWNDYQLLARTYIYGVSALAPDKVFMAGNDGFIYRGPLPGAERFIPVDKMGQKLHDIDMLDALHGWAVGNNGTILFHNGIGWINQHTNVNRDLKGVSALSANSAWAVGSSGDILYYDGSEWVTQANETDQDLYDVCAVDSSHIWAVGKHNTMLFNDGTAWSRDESVAFTAKSISGTGSDFVLAAGGTEINRYNGTKWEFERPSPHMLHDVYAFHQNNTNYAWAVGNKGYALFYNGHSWEEKPTGDPYERDLLGVYASDSDHAWAVGAGGTIYEYNGGTWTDHSWPTGLNLNDISGYDASHIWAAGNGSIILYYDGSGWQKQHDDSAHLNGVSAKSGNICLAVGSNETILQYDFDKNKWNDVSPSRGSQKLLGVSAADAANVWAVGENGAILYYDGSTWTDQLSGTTKHLRGVSAFDASHVWAVGDGGTILFYNGTDWMPQNNTGIDKNIYSVSAVAKDGVCAVGDKYAWFYNGSSWSTMGIKFNGKGVAGTDRNNFWAVDGSKNAWIYNSGSWTEHKDAADKSLYGISAFNLSGQAHIWAVGDSGRIAASTDGGSSWTPETSGTTDNLKSVSALNQNTVWAVGLKGTILRRGSGWEVQTSTTQYDLYGVSALAAHSVWAVGDKGTYDTILAAYPGIEWCNPQSVPRGRALDVNIVGGNTNFRDGDSQAAFSGAGIVVNKTAVTDARHATATITIAEDADCTQRGVNVITGGEVPYAMANALTIYDKSITKISPTAGVWGETGLNVDIYGNGTSFDETSYAQFVPPSGSNDITVNSTTYVSETHVVANIDIDMSADEKKYDVQVLTPGEQFAPVPLSEGFTIHDSRISHVDPPDFARGHTIDIDITGYETQFIDGQSAAVFVPPDGITVNTTTVTDTTHATANITIDASAPATARDVNVTTTAIPNPHPLAEGFTVRDPVITSTSPDSGVQGQWMAFDIYGEDTAFVNGQSYTTFDPPDGIAIIGTAVENPVHAVVGIIIAEDAPTTSRTVNVITPCAGVPAEETPQPLTGGFTVMPNTPHIDSLSQTSGPVGTEILVQGYNFGFVQDVSYVTFNGVDATEYTYWTKEEIGVKVPAGATTGPVTVTTIHGTSNGVDFTVTPKIDNLDPTLGPVDTEVTVTGTTFGDTQDGSYVSFNGTQATDYTSWSDLEVKVKVPPGATSGPVTLTTPDGTSNGVDFTVTPKIDDLDPTLGPVDTEVTVTGTTFGDTQDGSYVSFNGTQATDYTSWSDLEVKVKVPPGATSGPVTLTTPDGTSNGVDFTVTPKIDNLDPTLGPVDTEVTVTGTTFGDTRDGSYVSFNGTQATDYTSWSDLEVKVKVPPGATSGPVTLTIPDGTSNGVDFTVTHDTWYFAEGCTTEGMETWILVENPNPFPVNVYISFYTAEGLFEPAALQGWEVPGETRVSFNAGAFVTSTHLSTRVSSEGGEIFCERSMYGNNRTWGHNTIGATFPASTWYLAEGCTQGGMETWILVQNPNADAVEVELEFQTESGEVTGPKETLPGHTRRSFNAGEFVQGYDVSTQVNASGEVVCERSMYGNNRTWGHNSIGTSLPAQTWYLAEGCTEGGMETFILVQNPGDDEVEVELLFRTDSGEVQGPIVTIPARSRHTFNVGEFVKSYNVSTVVSAGGEVVCERSMYGGDRTWAHNSIGFAP